MQQHHQHFTMSISFGLLFRPSTDQASFGIKQKPHNCLNVKMGRGLFSFDINLVKLLKYCKVGETDFVHQKTEILLQN